MVVNNIATQVIKIYYQKKKCFSHIEMGLLKKYKKINYRSDIDPEVKGTIVDTMSERKYDLFYTFLKILVYGNPLFLKEKKFC